MARFTCGNQLPTKSSSTQESFPNDHATTIQTGASLPRTNEQAISALLTSQIISPERDATTELTGTPFEESQESRSSEMISSGPGRTERRIKRSSSNDSVMTEISHGPSFSLCSSSLCSSEASRQKKTTRKREGYIAATKRNRKSVSSASKAEIHRYSSGVEQPIENSIYQSRHKHRRFSQLIDILKRSPPFRFFLKPVDIQEFSCYDYYDVIKSPMDLTTMTNKLQSNTYFENDVLFFLDLKQIFLNCRLYNLDDERNRSLLELCDEAEDLAITEWSKFLKETKGSEAAKVLESHLAAASNLEKQFLTSSIKTDPVASVNDFLDSSNSPDVIEGYTNVRVPKVEKGKKDRLQKETGKRARQRVEESSGREEVKASVKKQEVYKNKLNGNKNEIEKKDFVPTTKKQERKTAHGSDSGKSRSKKSSVNNGGSPMESSPKIPYKKKPQITARIDNEHNSRNGNKGILQSSKNEERYKTLKSVDVPTLPSDMLPEVIRNNTGKNEVSKHQILKSFEDMQWREDHPIPKKQTASSLPRNESLPRTNAVVTTSLAEEIPQQVISQYSIGMSCDTVGQNLSSQALAANIPSTSTLGMIHHHLNIPPPPKGPPPLHSDSISIYTVSRAHDEYNRRSFLSTENTHQSHDDLNYSRDLKMEERITVSKKRNDESMRRKSRSKRRNSESDERRCGNRPCSQSPASSSISSRGRPSRRFSRERYLKRSRRYDSRRRMRNISSIDSHRGRQSDRHRQRDQCRSRSPLRKERWEDRSRRQQRTRPYSSPSGSLPPRTKNVGRKSCRDYRSTSPNRKSISRDRSSRDFPSRKGWKRGKDTYEDRGTFRKSRSYRRSREKANRANHSEKTSRIASEKQQASDFGSKPRDEMSLRRRKQSDSSVNRKVSGKVSRSRNEANPVTDLSELGSSFPERTHWKSSRSISKSCSTGRRHRLKYLTDSKPPKQCDRISSRSHDIDDRWSRQHEHHVHASSTPLSPSHTLDLKEDFNAISSSHPSRPRRESSMSLSGQSPLDNDVVAEKSLPKNIDTNTCDELQQNRGESASNPTSTESQLIDHSHTASELSNLGSMKNQAIRFQIGEQSSESIMTVREASGCRTPNKLRAEADSELFSVKAISGVAQSLEEDDDEEMLSQCSAMTVREQSFAATDEDDSNNEEIDETIDTAKNRKQYLVSIKIGDEEPAKDTEMMTPTDGNEKNEIKVVNSKKNRKIEHKKPGNSSRVTQMKEEQDVKELDPVTGSPDGMDESVSPLTPMEITEEKTENNFVNMTKQFIELDDPICGKTTLRTDISINKEVGLSCSADNKKDNETRSNETLIQSPEIPIPKRERQSIAGSGRIHAKLVAGIAGIQNDSAINIAEQRRNSDGNKIKGRRKKKIGLESTRRSLERDISNSLSRTTSISTKHESATLHSVAHEILPSISTTTPGSHSTTMLSTSQENRSSTTSKGSYPTRYSQVDAISVSRQTTNPSSRKRDVDRSTSQSRRSVSQWSQRSTERRPTSNSRSIPRKRSSERPQSKESASFKGPSQISQKSALLGKPLSSNNNEIADSSLINSEISLTIPLVSEQNIDGSSVPSLVEDIKREVAEVTKVASADDKKTTITELVLQDDLDVSSKFHDDNKPLVTSVSKRSNPSGESKFIYHSIIFDSSRNPTLNSKGNWNVEGTPDDKERKSICLPNNDPLENLEMGLTVDPMIPFAEEMKEVETVKAISKTRPKRHCKPRETKGKRKAKSSTKRKSTEKTKKKKKN